MQLFLFSLGIHKFVFKISTLIIINRKPQVQAYFTALSEALTNLELALVRLA